MIASDLDRSLRAAFDDSESAPEGTFRVTSEFALGSRRLLVASSPDARAALILPEVYESSPPGFATKHLRAYAAQSVTVSSNGKVRNSPAAIIECLDVSVLEPFAAMSAQIAGLLEHESSRWRDVYALIKRWSRLFAEARNLDENEALGLWGELWVLANSSILETMLEAWRGPHGGVADFVLEAGRLEVKTTTRLLTHHVSYRQTQLDSSGFFLSLALEEGAGGDSLGTLAERILSSVESPALFYDALARIGCSLETLALVKRRLVLVSPPALFRAEDVPAIRKFDQGISNLRYTVLLDAAKALPADEASNAARCFGLSFHA